MSTTHSQLTGGGPGPEESSENSILSTSQAHVQVNTSVTDDLLDEIDDLLEENAEDFVRSYIQKGGE